MKTAILLLCLGAAAGAQQPSKRPHHVLDIVTYTLTPEPAAPSDAAGLPSGHRGGTSHRRTGVTLRARLASLDLSSYELGDPLIYEIELENAGTRPILLPWSPDRVRFVSRGHKGTPPNKAIISLQVWDVTGSGRPLATLEPQSLFGSPNIAGSLQSLAPAEIALISVPGVLRAVETEMRAILREPLGAVQVRGVITLLQEQVIVRTTNGIEVSVRDPLRR